MIESHPFAAYIPELPAVLILGSFPGKEHTQDHTKNNSDAWYYGAKRNQFWKILSKVYDIELVTKNEKQKLFASKGIAISDILLKVDRINGSNLDKNLIVEEYNETVIKKILDEHPNIKVLFTSRFVEDEFRKLFPNFLNTLYLPSPSPRYARKSFDEKVIIYQEILPK